MGGPAHDEERAGPRRWVGEFADRELEARFLVEEGPVRGRFARVACWAFVAVAVVLAGIDAALVDEPARMALLVGVRLLTVLPAAVLAAALGRPNRGAPARLMTMVEALLLAGHVTLAGVDPADGPAGLIGLVALSVAVVTLGTNRVRTRATLVVTAWIGWTAVAVAVEGRTWAVAAPVAAVAAGVLGVSLVAATRAERTQRREWWLRHQERELNIRLSAEIRRRERIERDLVHRANVDVLTGLPNRRHFMELAEAEFARAERSGEELSIVVMDVDHFKEVNDHHGHAGGDEVLRTLSTLLREQLRRIDILGRLGGEEFAVVMPRTKAARATAVIERVSRRVRDEPVLLLEGPVRLTVSAGVVEADVWTETVDDALARADAAMYRAKYDGRDRVVVAP